MIKKIEWIFLFLLHLALLAWILFVLGKAGELDPLEVTLHFFGLALSGALLIRLCAFLAKKRFERERSENSRPLS